MHTAHAHKAHAHRKHTPIQCTPSLSTNIAAANPRLQEAVRQQEHGAPHLFPRPPCPLVQILLKEDAPLARAGGTGDPLAPAPAPTPAPAGPFFLLRLTGPRVPQQGPGGAQHGRQ